MGHRNLSPALGGGGERNGKKERDDGRKDGSKGFAPIQHKKERKKNVKNALSGLKTGRRIDF